jgi:CubicO group peptidase (beta-lactamase class C family)
VRLPAALPSAEAALLVVLTVSPVLAQSRASSAATDLLGLRGADTTFGPQVRGSLVIEPVADGWIAHVAGLEARSIEAGNQWRFVFPDSQGELVVAVPRPGRALHGFWIQRPGQRGSFATPVALSILWSPAPVLRGEIIPLDDSPDQAPSAPPRPPSASTYAYQTPIPGGDGWPTAAASAVGLDDRLLVALVRRIAATDPAGPDAPPIHAVLVARHGKLVLDEYFSGFSPDRPHDVGSAAGAFSELTAGIAIDHGVFKSDAPACGIDLAGALAAKAIGTSLLEFFDEYVAVPLEIRTWHMKVLPSGEAYPRGGLYMRPRDVLKLGQLWLDDGKWNGDHVVGTRWVEQSTRPRTDTSDGTANRSAWHIGVLDQGGRAWREYDAAGDGGQLLIVLPALDMVVVVTTGNDNRSQIGRKVRDELVSQYIIGAVNEQRK